MLANSITSIDDRNSRVLSSFLRAADLGMPDDDGVTVTCQSTDATYKEGLCFRAPPRNFSFYFGSILSITGSQYFVSTAGSS